ncbi:MAG: hypothetical protein QOJ23_5192 [Actinomycetota bacterium]|nr:hypothetical protein [Actinomycetota bacterium]
MTAAPTREDLRNDLRRLCQDLFNSEQVMRLAKFAEQCDEAGARTFGCLLYCLNQHEDAVFWWRFAAGAGDRLAAHCLAVHHAADGTHIDARLWRAIARTMGFDSTQLPSPADNQPILPEAPRSFRTVTPLRWVHPERKPVVEES